MKSMYTKLALMLLLIFSMTMPKDILAGVDEEEMKEKLPLMMGQSNVGKEYWFTIPPCYEETTGDNFIKILVASPSKTRVVVEVPGNGFYKTQETVPNGVIEFAVKPVEGQAVLHQARTNQTPPAKVYKGAGIHVYSDDPIVIYVVVKYRATSDGFLAIPVSAFGTKYINMVYQEPNFKLYYNYSGLASPFTGVTAAYDNTKVNFTMGGGPNGDDAVKLDGGQLIRTGQSTAVTMMRGDVWLLGVDDVEQDLSGSIFEANKPFSIVSGVHCANFPVGNFWCDYTVEMELPTYTWGKQYYVVPMAKRGFNGIIRVYASEDNTEIFRDGAYIGTIKKGGGDTWGKAYIETRLWPMYVDEGPVQVQNPPKIATISADKPIQVMYYNTGTQEDGIGGQSDPFQMVQTPIEQFQTEMYFASPNALGGGDVFTENYINLVFELHEDFMPEDLQFAEFSTNGREPQWVPISQQFGGGFKEFAIPYQGKRFATTTITLGTEGVYGIKSDSTRFASYSYGYAPYESYGFPTSAALKDLTKPDTNAPVPTYIQECNGDVLKDMGNVTDMPNDESVRSNMADLYMVKELSENYLFDWRSKSGEFIPGQIRTLSWWLTVIDKKKYAKATLYFVDRAGNDTTIVIEYFPPEYEVTGDLHYGTLAETGPPVILQDTIRNLSTTSPLYITRVELQNNNQGFSIDSYEPAGWTPPMAIAAGEEVIVNIEFDPVAALAGGKRPIYKDSLGVGYGDENFEECGFEYETLQDAFLGAPVIVVGDWDFGSLNIATAGTVSKVIQIKNEGDNPLNITGISSDLTVPEFTHDFKTKFPSVSISSPLTIDPGKTETFTAYFTPLAEATYSDQIVFQSDAKEDRDNVCELLGVGISSAIDAQGADWGGYLIDRPAFPAGPYDVEASVSHSGLYIANLGKLVDNIKTKVELVEIVNESPAGVAREYFRAGGMNIFDYLNSNNIKGIVIDPEETLDHVVQYLPTAKGDHSITIRLTFDDNVSNATAEVRFTGTGLVPNLEVTDVTYPTPMLINDEVNFQSGQNMVITNTQIDEFGYPLTISNVTFAADANVSRTASDFTGGETFALDGALLTALTATPLAVGESVSIPVEFVARDVNNQVIASIESNADDQANTYDNNSEWTGIGYNAGLVVSDDDSEICIGATDQLSLTITNNSEQDILIDRLSLQMNGVDVADIDGDTQPDISISNNTAGINVAKNGGEWTVNIFYTPTGFIPPLTKLDLNIEHSYGDLIGINQNIGAITVSSKFFDGSTSSNVTGAVASPSSNGFDKKFMISIGDDFFYEINTNSDVSNADVQSVDVELFYNRFFVQPEFSMSDLSKIELANNSMEILPTSFTNEAVVGGVIGSQLIKFTIQSTNGAPVLANPTTLVRLPFLAVLPADSDEFDPKEVLGTKGENLGLFDMSHTISDADCYMHTQDKVEVGIKEICTGDLRLLYIGDLAGTPPSVQPNPISTNGGTIEYSVPFDRPGQIVLYDASMKQVAVLYDGIMKQGRQTIEIPSSQLANGSYFFKIEMGKEKAMGRLVIQK